MNKLIIIFFTAIFLNASNFTNKSISISSINSTSHEYVYQNDFKLSELIWETKDVSLLGLEFDYLLRKDSILNFSYKINISKGDSLMNDFDWLKNDASNWSHWSNHPNTKLENFSILDINVKQYLEDTNNLNIYFTLGYKIVEKKFKAYDGTAIYSTKTGFRDSFGSFSGLGITYKETFNSLYLGIGGNKKYNKFNLKTSFKYSPFVDATNSDTHHFRSFTNENKFDQTTMQAINIDLEYNYTKSLLFVIKYENVAYEETRGTTTRTYYDTTSDTYTNGSTIPKGTVLSFGGAGIDNSYNSLNIGIIKKF